MAGSARSESSDDNHGPIVRRGLTVRKLVQTGVQPFDEFFGRMLPVCLAELDQPFETELLALEILGFRDSVGVEE